MVLHGSSKDESADKPSIITKEPGSTQQPESNIQDPGSNPPTGPADVTEVWSIVLKMSQLREMFNLGICAKQY